MQRTKQLVVLASLLALTSAAYAGGQDTDGEKAKQVKVQTTCPVTNNPIDPEAFADHEGQRVHFCCAGCIEPFMKDPARHIKKLEDAGVTVALTPRPQTHCPVMGNEIDREVFLDHEGRRVYFCCPPCKDRFTADPDTYLKKLQAEGVTLEKLPEKKKEHDEHAGHGHGSHEGHNH